ncbi:outer membrane protein assembly factor BamB family protein [Parapedobacter lycopersici]|uniref:outer membrane protein assembly factor BamB family protein n=1 Tax=Parapedobacter lycopersici TaxID=1864939 RepID=UPI00214D86F9|nr:PQQ-binding-like beta-propeller repeat protein [Parapedobacter lycopersici]
MKHVFMMTTVLCMAACGNPNGGSDEQTNTATSSTDSISVVLSQAWATDTTSLITPECVTYDPARNQFYVSNINRQSDAENAGYIALVGADGSIKNAKWVTGFKGPLGNEVHGDFLYVNDRNTIVKIDIATGKIVERITVDGAGALNGMDIAEDGTIYAADSKTNGIFRVSPDGQAKMIVQSDSLETPNGVLINGDELLVASSHGGSLKAVNLGDGSIETRVAGLGQVDGIIPLEGGRYLTSSWKGEVYFIDENGKQQKILDTKDQAINAADIGYIPNEKLLVIPTFHDNRLVAYRMEIRE